MCTIYKAIISENETFEISIIKSNKYNKWYKEPALELLPHQKEIRRKDYEYSWDNPGYLKELYKCLKNKKKTGPWYNDFKQFCKEHKLDFKQTRKEFIELIKQSKKEKFWPK